MAINWNGGPTSPSDPSKFDYETAAAKVQRQRAAAQALQTMGMQTNQGQFVKNGDFIGFSGGNTLASTAARMAAAYLGSDAVEGADGSQKQLGLDSQAALSWALDPKNSPAGQRGAADQMQREAEAELQRESQRGNRTVNGGEYVDTQSPDAAPMQTNPVEAPQIATTTAPTATPVSPAPPVNPAIKQSALKVLGSPAPAVMKAAHPTQSVTGGPQSFGTGADISRRLAPATNLPTGATGALSANDIAFASKMLGGPLASAANASRTSQNVSQPSPAPVTIPVLPTAPARVAALPLPQNTQPTPQQAAPQQAAPQQAAPPLDTTATSLGIDPTAGRGPGDPRSMVDQSAASANGNASYGEQMANLQQIARTGPMGQQLATAMMQSQYSKDWGEVKNADGATVGVYNKRNPNEMVGFQGTNTGTKTIEAAQSVIKNTDYTNPDAMLRLNQTLSSLGQSPMNPQQVAGMQLSASDRVTHNVSLNKAQGEVANDIATSRNSISSIDKGISDAERMVTLSATVGSRYPAVSTMEQLWSQYGRRDPDVDELRQLYAQNTMAAAREALAGQGRLNQQEFGVFQSATPNMQTSPAAVANLLAPTIALMKGKLDTEHAILSERAGRYKRLGGDPRSFDEGQGQTQAPGQSPKGGASTGRAPGNYQF